MQWLFDTQRTRAKVNARDSKLSIQCEWESEGQKSEGEGREGNTKGGAQGKRQGGSVMGEAREMALALLTVGNEVVLGTR